MGRRASPTRHTMRLRLTGRLGRRDGREAQTTGRPTGRPFFCRACPFRTCPPRPRRAVVFEPGEVVSYFEMCREEGSSLQRGMNYRLRGGDSVVLMSRRPGAPYADRVEEDGRVLIYEGHEYGSPNRRAGSEGAGPTAYDGQWRADAECSVPFGGEATCNQWSGTRTGACLEKLRQAHLGLHMASSERSSMPGTEESNARQVFKFRLELDFEVSAGFAPTSTAPGDRRVAVATPAKLAVWR